MVLFLRRISSLSTVDFLRSEIEFICRLAIATSFLVCALRFCSSGAETYYFVFLALNWAFIAFFRAFID